MTKQLDVFLYRSPVGELLLATTEKGLCLCDWLYRKQRKQIDSRIERLTGKSLARSDYIFDASKDIQSSNEIPKLIGKAIIQLNEYFANERKQFDIPLDPLGTPFQKHVWNTLINIPYGKTQTYKGLAKDLNQLAAIRAVAAANGANALSIFIPCHRIIGSTGDLVGYAGGLQAKQKLLELEQPNLFD